MLAEVGYDGVTIEAVAHAAGVSKNAIPRLIDGRAHHGAC